jgi:hypothetical protein
MKTLRGKEALNAALAKSRGRGPRIRVAPKAERTCDGILFASKAEKNRYLVLRDLQSAGKILFFLRQVPVHLPGGVKYVADFLVFEHYGRFRFEDVKGHRTELYKLKKRLVESLYPITIHEIGK